MAAEALDVTKYFDLGHQGDYDWTQVDRALAASPTQRLRRHEYWRVFVLEVRNRGIAVSPTFITDTIVCLSDAAVEFIVVGGVCAILHGSAHVTKDLDVCYRHTPENIRRIVAALAPLNPRLRNFPAELPFTFDERTLLLGSNFTFVADDNEFDLLGTMSGLGGYDDIVENAVEMDICGRRVKVLALADLIATKAAADRAKDHVVLPMLREMLERQRAAQRPDAH